MEQKAELVVHATNGRVTSSSDMTDEEALRLIRTIEPPKTPSQNAFPKDLEGQIQDVKRHNTFVNAFRYSAKWAIHKAFYPIMTA